MGASRRPRAAIGHCAQGGSPPTWNAAPPIPSVFDSFRIVEISPREVDVISCEELAKVKGGRILSTADDRGDGRGRLDDDFLNTPNTSRHGLQYLTIQCSAMHDEIMEVRRIELHDAGWLERLGTPLPVFSIQVTLFYSHKKYFSYVILRIPSNRINVNSILPDSFLRPVNDFKIIFPQGVFKQFIKFALFL